MTFYTIKAIPTTYAGVNFRSRLEARWAAFFDLAGIKWDYEPFDLEGWAPDFLLRTQIGPVLCEVKPADLITYVERQLTLEKLEPFPFDAEYAKAARYKRMHAVCLLGDAPLSMIDHMPIGIIDGPPTFAKFTFDDMHEALTPRVDTEFAWREAGNVVQWNAATDSDDLHTQMRRVFKRKAA